MMISNEAARFKKEVAVTSFLGESKNIVKLLGYSENVDADFKMVSDESSRIAHF